MAKAFEITILEGAIHCDGCQHRIQNVLSRMPGVSAVKANRNTQKVQVTIEDEKPTLVEVMQRLERLGYPVKKT